jgi:hypothetical protein
MQIVGEDDMKVCGVDLSAHDAIVVVLNGTRRSWHLVNCEPRKITLPDDEEAGQVRAFRDAMDAFVRYHGIQRMAVKKRGKKGKFAGGSVSFKMEGLIQLIEMCDVILLPPQTIAKVAKKYPNVFPEELNQYQRGAFYTALTALDA